MLLNCNIFAPYLIEKDFHKFNGHLSFIEFVVVSNSLLIYLFGHVSTSLLVNLRDLVGLYK